MKDRRLKEIIVFIKECDVYAPGEVIPEKEDREETGEASAKYADSRVKP